MNLRSLKLVNFRGVRELTVRDLPRDGIVRVDVPEDAEPGALADAVRFALTGSDPEGGPPMARGEGFAYVEAGLRLPGDARASVFRGVDRRGKGQASLREAGGQRVTGGSDGVASRLSELTGGDPQRFARAAVIDTSGGTSPARTARSGGSGGMSGMSGTTRSTDSMATDSMATGPMAAGPVASVVADPVADAKLRVERAVTDLTRSLRAERLRSLAGASHEDLVAAAGRLRREREVLSQQIDGLHAERARVRARLPRLEEYRRLAQPDTGRLSTGSGAERRDGAPPRANGALEWCLAVIALALFGLLAFVTASENTAFEDHRLRAFVGMAFVASAASFMGVASARHRHGGRYTAGLAQPAEPARAEIGTLTGAAAATHAAIAAGGPERAEHRDALRSRFSDLGNPDDPALPGRLRDDLAALDQELSPLHDRMESLDDGLAVAEVEIGRSARALHTPLPPKELPAAGLADGESVRDAVDRAREMGDLVFKACVERDALLADTAPDTATAKRHAVDALTALGAATGRDADLVFARERIASAHTEAIAHAAEDELAATVLADVARASSGGAAHRDPVAHPAPVARPSGDAGLARVVSAVTRGAYNGIDHGDGEPVLLRSDGGRDALDAVGPSLRARVMLACRIVESGADGQRPGFLVLERAPDLLADEDLLDVVRAAAPDVSQILVPSR